MDQYEAYKQKMEAELELVQAKLAEFKAQMKISAADAQLKYGRQVDEIEQKLDAMKVKFKELSESGEDAWGDVKEGVENAWATLRATVAEAAAKLKQ
ncbi:MAG: hypothetical protein JXK04_03285 [Campylobacterales bacterium]|nr:hypothetical protein [Campylobacterales bacterium]